MHPWRILLLLFGLLLHHVCAQGIDMSSTPGWANLDTCIQWCFTGAHPDQSLEMRLGCTTKHCLCNANIFVEVKEFMELCSTLRCAKPRRLEWWKVGAWSTVFHRYCEGDFGSVVGDGDGLGREVW